MKLRIVNLAFLLTIIFLNNCQSNECTYINSKGETLEHFDEVIIQNISFPSVYSGIVATAVEITVVNKNKETEKYYSFYSSGKTDFFSQLIKEKKYTFYYETKEYDFSIHAGEKMENIGKVKWLLDYIPL